LAYGDSPAASLAAVQAAIAACLLNQQYRIGDRMFKKADLNKLYEMEKTLEAKVKRANNSRPGAVKANFGGYFS